MSHKPGHFEKELDRLFKEAGITQERGMVSGRPTGRMPQVSGDPQALSQSFTTRTPYRGKTTGSTSASVQTKKRVKRLKKKKILSKIRGLTGGVGA